MEIYKLIGYHYGKFTDEHGNLRNYATIFVTSPLGDSREGYQASGLKAEGKKCIDTSVLVDALNEVAVGDDVQLYFTEWKKVALIKAV